MCAQQHGGPTLAKFQAMSASALVAGSRLAGWLLSHRYRKCVLSPFTCAGAVGCLKTSRGVCRHPLCVHLASPKRPTARVKQEQIRPGSPGN